MRQELGDEYVDEIYALYGERIPNSSDLCCYWFEKARAQIEAGSCKRAGLLATQAIRFQSNRPVLQRIKESGDIFHVISDREWRSNDPEAASVNISIICFDDGCEERRVLNGVGTSNINPDLTHGPDLTQAKRLSENTGISFAGEKKHGPFEITHEVAEYMLSQPNVHGKPNSDVVKPWIIGRDINQTSRDMWIIDFGTEMSEADAALYEVPFEHIRSVVKPQRDNHRDARLRRNWWLHGRPRVEMRRALGGLPRYIGTSQVSQHRLFSFIDSSILPDATVVVFSCDDDYFFGLLQSRIHVVWTLAVGTQLQSRPRYIISTCFETFPFPSPDEEQRVAIAAAADELNQLRENWLNPLDMLGEPALSAQEKRRRTLTNLYNDNPTWLRNAHAKLDAAVADAYEWPHDLSDEEILDRLLALNLERVDAKEQDTRTEDAE